MKQLLAIVIVALSVSIASAQPTSAVCRIRSRSTEPMPPGQYMDELGSGTLTFDNGNAGIIYSCAHIFKDADLSTVMCTFADGRAFRGIVIALDEASDFSAVAIASPKNITPFPVGKYESGPITLGGWGNEREPLRFVAGELAPTQWADPGQHNVRNAVLRQGDSGGPAINNGRLVGIAWGAAEGESFYRSDAPFEQFDAGIKSLIKSGAQIRQVALTQCSNGGCCQNGYCPNGSCQMQYAPQQVYRQPTQSRPQTVTQTPVPQVSLPGPAGPPGNDATCDCGPKWQSIDTRISAIEADIKAGKATVDNLVSVVNEINQRPAAPSIEDIVAEVERRRKPPRIRIVDPQGKYTTEFKSLDDGTDTDLQIDQRFTQPTSNPVH